MRVRGAASWARTREAALVALILIVLMVVARASSAPAKAGESNDYPGFPAPLLTDDAWPALVAYQVPEPIPAPQRVLDPDQVGNIDLRLEEARRRLDTVE